MSATAQVSLAGRPVGPGAPVYLVAEIGSNHDRDKGRALDMIAMAAAAGADAVKFQCIRFDRLYDGRRTDGAFRDWFRQIELDEDWLPELAAAAARQGVHFLASPTYEEAVDLLEAVGVPAHKLASPQVQADPRVVRRAARTGKPLLMSFGYCDEAEIRRAVGWCREEGNGRLVALHCVSRYPCPPGEAALRFLPALAALAGAPVGFSDHTPGAHLAVAAVALGACVVEKHVTTDRARPGPDHHFALTFPEFAALARQVRETETALGDGRAPALAPEVMALRDKVRLRAYAARDVAAGEPLAAAVVFHRGDEPALGYDDLEFLKRCRAARPLAEGEPLDRSVLVTPEKP